MQKEILNNAWLGVKMTDRLTDEANKLIEPYLDVLRAQNKTERNKVITKLLVRFKKSQLKRRQIRVNRVLYAHG